MLAMHENRWSWCSAHRTHTHTHTKQRLRNSLPPATTTTMVPRGMYRNVCIAPMQFRLNNLTFIEVLCVHTAHFATEAIAQFKVQIINYRCIYTLLDAIYFQLGCLHRAATRMPGDRKCSVPHLPTRYV